ASPLVCFLRDPSTTQISPLSLHDALPIYEGAHGAAGSVRPCLPQRHADRDRWVSGRLHPRVLHGFAADRNHFQPRRPGPAFLRRSEEHTSELQSRENLVCRLLLEKKNTVI